MVIGVCVAYALIWIVTASISPESLTGSLMFTGVTAIVFVLVAILPLPLRKG